MNRILSKSRIFAIIISLAFAATVRAQSTVAVGIYPFGSYSGGSFDRVNNANLNAHFSIPILSKAGPTLPFKYSLSYNSSVWYETGVNGSMTWTPVNAQDWGWTAMAENVGTGGYVSLSEIENSCLIYQDPHGVNYYYYWWDYYNYVYHDSAGGSHPFDAGVTTWHSGAPCGSDSWPNYAIVAATDNSGYILNTSYQTITSQQGIKFSVPFTTGVPSSSADSETNPDGNQISSSVSGQTTTYTDALGMTVLTAASSGSPTTQETYTYSATGDVPAQVVVKYSTYTVRTNFGCSAVVEFPPTPEQLVTEIDLADDNPGGTRDRYLFTYEQTPGYSGDVTGRLASVTLPTGGTITYAYSGGSHGIECSDGSTSGLTRTVSPGGVWTYTRSNVSGNEWKTQLSDPNSNSTSMYFQFFTPTGSTAALAYETERDLPGGSETDLACYNGHPSPCTNSSDTTAISLPITRKTVMHTIGSETSEVDTQYDGNGYSLPIEVDQYDFGTSGSPGPLLRKTVTAYDYNTSCGIPSGSSIVDQSCTVTVEDGSGTAIAKTVNTYDANGNLTSTVSGLSPTQLTKSFTYNSNGTVATATDVNNKVTDFAYNGTGGCSDAYPTSVTGPTPPALTVSAQWDCYAGVATSVKDPNGNTTSFGYDSMNRLISTSYPNGGSVTTTYSPTLIQTTTKITSAASRTDTTGLDGQGRILSQTAAGVETDKTYDSLGRISTVSINGSGQQDTYSYDVLSRITKITHADNTYSQTGYSNNCTTSTDESGKARTVCVDGLGRTTEAIEDPSGLDYTTTYAYDALNDLTGVTQGSETRSFTYDSLSRLTQSVTPESGTVNYTYDTDSTCGTYTGDLVKRVDARSKRTCYAYDSIHRLTSNTYSDSTPSVTYDYDQTIYDGLSIANGLGRLTGMSDGSGETAWSYDTMGRVVKQEKTISGVTKSISYGYNDDGSVASLTYPSGHVITYGVDSEGRPATAVDTGSGINYVTGGCSGGACYAPQDVLSSMVSGKTGTFAGITYSVSYNNRLLPSAISAASTNGTALSLGYSYFSNGNVETITNSRDTGRTATYGYDSLNRINSASSQATSGADCWGQTVPSGGYDRYGNLLQINVSKCTAPSFSLSVNTKNQITNTGYSYDASGDELGDGTNTFTWDAERRMTTSAGVTFTFDGNFERVMDTSPKLYWYGLDGSVLAETDGSGNPVNEYIYFDGMRIARRDASGSVYYSFGNELGSPTVTTATGSLCYDADFFPFGGERAYTSTCAPNQKFAGMEQDSATGLYRTIFRQYAANNGRWLSPDPYRGSYDPTNPQTMNRYAYVGNMPMNHIDPMGLNWACTFGYSEEGGGWELNCWYISTCADFNDCRTSPTGPSQPSGSGGQGAGGGKSQPPPQPQPQQQKHTCHELNVYANQLKVVGVATALVGGGIALIPGAQPIGAVTALSGGVVNLSGNLVSLGTSIFCK